MPDERDEDERDEDERDEDEGEEGSEPSTAIAAPEGEEEQPDAPRNRAERRAEMRRQKREGPRGATEGARREPGAPPRVTVPKPTLKGKSSADEVPPWARNSAEWMNSHRGLLALGAALVIGVAGAAVYWTMHTERVQGDAANAFDHGIELSRAPVRGPDSPPEPPNAPPQHLPTYTDATARSRAALAAFQQTAQRYATQPIAPLARLAEGETLYDLGRYAEARRTLEALVQGGADLAGLQARAYEVLGFALEALNDQAGALRRFETMATLDNGAWRDLAQYHQARVLDHQGNQARAKELLHGVIERIQHARPDDPGGATDQGSVLEQARLMLHDIDPTDPLGHRSETPTDPRELMRLLQQRGIGAPGAGAPGGGGGEE